MSATQEDSTQVSQFDLQTTPGQGGVGEAAGAYWERIKGGDLGALPAVIGAVVLVIVFGIMEPDSFLTEQNFANLLNQGAAIMVLAMGLVFVLLLGEIDLSAGFTAGTGAAILGVTLTNHGWNWVLSVIAVLLTGMVIGFSMGVLVARLGIPSFVVSLAYFLGLQGDRHTFRQVGGGGVGQQGLGRWQHRQADRQGHGQARRLPPGPAAIGLRQVDASGQEQWEKQENPREIHRRP